MREPSITIAVKGVVVATFSSINLNSIHALSSSFLTFPSNNANPPRIHTGPLLYLVSFIYRLLLASSIKVLYHPPTPTPGRISFRFHAIPLGALSRCGRIYHESEDKLEMKVPSQRLDLANEVKQAWVCKYVEKGVECVMTLGPSMPNNEYEIVIEQAYKNAKFKRKRINQRLRRSSVGFGMCLVPSSTEDCISNTAMSKLVISNDNMPPAGRTRCVWLVPPTFNRNLQLVSYNLVLKGVDSEASILQSHASSPWCRVKILDRHYCAWTPRQRHDSN
ncbi:hypothetical protein F5B20DRAFT_551853 [Whalleya microplaca]|nr:hypothetical protein F5B20DRAFT_551853 [Whalleya microplaca]